MQNTSIVTIASGKPPEGFENGCLIKRYCAELGVFNNSGMRHSIVINKGLLRSVILLDNK